MESAQTRPQKSENSRAPCTVIWLVRAQTLMTGFPNWDVMRGCVRDYPLDTASAVIFSEVQSVDTSKERDSQILP